MFSTLANEDIHLVSFEKYPNDIHVIKSEIEFDDAKIISCEPCCGTHVLDTGHLGGFIITDVVSIVVCANYLNFK